MHFNIVNESTSSGFTEGFVPARFLGVEKITTTYGDAYKLQFSVLVEKAGVLTETAFKTGVFASTKDNTGSLKQNLIEEFFAALGLGIKAGVDLPMLGEKVPDELSKPVTIYLADKDGKKNMAYRDRKIFWEFKKESSGKKSSYL